MPLGILYNGLDNASEFLALAMEAESLGVSSAWIAEQSGYQDGFVVAAALLERTKGLKVRVGAVSPYARHPMIIAMSGAALEEIAPGRAGLVVGTGGPVNLAACGIRVERPVGTMVETVEAVRALLKGESLSVQGQRFTFNQAKLGQPAPEMPIYLAAIGPKMQAAAAAVADGVVFSSGHSTQFLKMSQKRIRQAHASSGRAEHPFACVGFIAASVDADRGVALAQAKKLLSHVFSGPHKAEDWALNGVNVDYVAISEALRTQNWDEAKRHVSDELVQLHSASGTPQEFQRRICDYLEAGLDVPVLAPLGTLAQRRLAVRLALEVMT